MDVPPDRFNLVYMNFLLHGIGTLIAWNMFITAIGYFIGYKLSEDYIGYQFPYLPNFMQYLTFASQIPNVGFNWMNVFVRVGGDLTTRIVWGISIEIVLFLVTVTMAMLDTSSYPYVFFWITMVCVVILNMASGIYQNTVFGLAAKLPGKYMGAIILGNNICGTFAAIVSIVSSAVASNMRIAAIYYFITAIFVLLICFDAYFALPLNKYYRHFDSKEKTGKKTEETTATPPYYTIIKQAWIQLYNVYFVFLVTLTVFPSILAGIRSLDEHFFIPPKYFAAVTCFITFNIFATIGSWLPTYFIWPKPQYLWIPVTLRILYIPFYLLCNYQVEGAERKMAVVVTNDWVHWVVTTTMAFTSGYLSSLAMMYAPGTVEEQHAPTAGMLAAAFLITGIFSGILLSFLWPWLITVA